MSNGAQISRAQWFIVIYSSVLSAPSFNLFVKDMLCHFNRFDCCEFRRFGAVVFGVPEEKSGRLWVGCRRNRQNWISTVSAAFQKAACLARFVCCITCLVQKSKLLVFFVVRANNIVDQESFQIAFKMIPLEHL